MITFTNTTELAYFVRKLLLDKTDKNTYLFLKKK